MYRSLCSCAAISSFAVSVIEAKAAPVVDFTSNAQGEISIPLVETGTHLIMTRMQAPALADAETDIRSYTTSLTFNVAREG